MQKEDEMEEQIKSRAQALVAKLLERGMRITVAEACTGGAISSAITAVNGASAVFEGSVVCYANGVKSSILGVNSEIFVTKGAVSAECVTEMAQGVADLFSADLAIAASGIEGPGGGSPEKPVGTVFICVTVMRQGRSSPMVVENHFSGSREEIRKQTVLKALRLASAALSGEIYGDLALPLALSSDVQGEDPGEGSLYEELSTDDLLGQQALCCDEDLLFGGGMPSFGEELSPFEGALLEDL